jgi:hypothetical protein
MPKGIKGSGVKKVVTVPSTARVTKPVVDATPKRRGRPPKVTSEPTQVEVLEPKKRGRPTKDKPKPDVKVSPKTQPKKVASNGLVDGKSWYREKDLPWNPKKVSLFKALKALKAYSEEKARSSADIAAASDGTLGGKDVRHYSYHAKAGNLIGIVTDTVGTGYLYYLTAEGRAVNPEKEYAAQEKAKKAKKVA